MENIQITVNIIGRQTDYYNSRDLLMLFYIISDGKVYHINLLII